MLKLERVRRCKYASDDKETDHLIYEFFVMLKYRRAGVGRQALFQVLDKNRGRWGLGYHPKNIASAHFWPAVIKEYTGGQYESISNPKHVYSDGSVAVNLYFDNRNFAGAHHDAPVTKK